MNLLRTFQEFIAKENLFSAKDILLLAVSGGIDSVVLCQLCYEAGYDFTMVHCNFQLRAAESSRDEQFVRKLAEKYNKQLLVKHFDTTAYAAENKVSIQVAARELRYTWFYEIIRGQYPGFDIQPPRIAQESFVAGTGAMDSPRAIYLLTAHHLDDNIETILMNFFKGTGITGLRGMLSKQGKIVRPLLFAKKEMLLAFAEAHTLNWVEDSSNQSDKYARNYFRNQLIPLVKNIYPEAEKNLAHNLQRFQEAALLYQQSVDLHKKKLLEYKDNEVHIPVLKLQKTVPLLSVLYEIIKDYGFSAGQATETATLLESETGRYVQSATHRIFKNRNWLIVSPNQSTEAGIILIDEKDAAVNFDGGRIIFSIHSNEPVPAAVNPSAKEALLDASGIVFPLLLRKWKAGDYFYPLGMRKKKKLSRFFIDQKLSKTDKEKIWILESAKKIIWVVGLRIDDRCKITSSTQQVLHIRLQ